MEGEIKNLIQVWFSIIASLCYCYFISSNIPKGKYRLLSLFPIFSLFTLLPFHLTYAFPAAVTAFFITWLASFKLILFSFGLGPLSPDPPNPLPLHLFIIIACLPIRTKPQQNHQIQNPQKLPKISTKSSKPTKLSLNLATETVILSLLLGFIHDYREIIHPTIVLVLYCFMVFLMVDVLVALSNAAVRAAVGLELEPPSDEPYFSTSLQDFWGRRWNLMVTNTLRHTVYKPVRSACEKTFLGREWASVPAVLSAFIVSGLMHELLFYYVTRASPTWETTGFFVLHGVCVVAETGAKKLLTGRWRLHRAVSGPLTVGFVVATSFWLFFPPLLKNGADVKVIKEFKIFVDLIAEKILG